MVTAPRDSRQRPVVPALGKALGIAAGGVGGVAALHSGHQVLPQFLNKGVGQRVQVVGTVVLHVKGRGDDDEGLNDLLGDELVHHVLVLAVLQQPGPLVIAGAVEQIEDVVLLLRVIPGGQIDISGLLHLTLVGGIGLGLVGQLLHRSPLLTGLGKTLRHRQMSRPAV